MIATFKARLGLLLTTLVMGSALVISGVSGYLAANQHAGLVTRAEIELAHQALLTDLRLSRFTSEPRSTLLQRVYSTLRTRGCTYIGLADDDSSWIVRVGVATDPAFFPIRVEPDPNERVEMLKSGVHARLVAAMPGSGRPGRGARLNSKRSPVRREGAKFVVMELISGDGTEVLARASRDLALALTSAFILITTSVVFWHLSDASEKAGQHMAKERARNALQLEKDRQLKVLGQMSAVLGHELRNPLASLKGHAQLLLEKLEANLRAHYGLRTIVADAELLESLTEQILEFAKTGAVRPEPTAIERLLADVVKSERFGVVEVAIDKRISSWSIDRQQVAKALANLLRNARQATPKGDPLHLSARPDQGLLLLEVSDNGEGIAQDSIDSVFDPFVTTRIEGTGLGLAFVRRVVEAHGGSASARNDAGGGGRNI
ncbi:MAG: HAMP domain-containing sensor histidine kinase [Nannocystaceae bacterium]